MLNRPARTLFSRLAQLLLLLVVFGKLESANTACDPSGWWLWSLLGDDDKQSTLGWELNRIWCIQKIVWGAQVCCICIL